LTSARGETILDVAVRTTEAFWVTPGKVESRGCRTPALTKKEEKGETVPEAD
jgi:hypothetical protein